MKITVRGIIFDADGVEVDSTKTSAERFLWVATIRKLPVTPEIIAQKDIISRIGGDAINLFWPDEDKEAFYSDWEKVDLAYNFQPIPGTREALETLRSRHYQSSILSNRGDRTLIPLIYKLGIAHLFVFVCGCAGRKYMKPDVRSADPVLEFYETLAIKPNELIFVGDSFDADWPVARDLGIPFVGVLSGVSSREEFLSAGVPAENIIRSVADLPDWLQKYDI